MKEVPHKNWNLGSIGGRIANVGAVAWILFEMVLFRMPTALPVSEVSMIYASMVLMRLVGLSTVWYAMEGRNGELFSHFWWGRRELICLQSFMDRPSRWIKCIS